MGNIVVASVERNLFTNIIYCFILNESIQSFITQWAFCALSVILSHKSA